MRFCDIKIFDPHDLSLSTSTMCGTKPISAAISVPSTPELDISEAAGEGARVSADTLSVPES